jgi:hypothetical protein
MLTTSTPPRTTHSTFESHTMPATRRTLLGLHLFHAFSAVGGGIALIIGALPVPLSVLRHTPFDSFVVPGIFLGIVVGGSAAMGASALLAHSRRAPTISVAGGAVMVGWILGETALVEGFSWLQGLYLLTGSIVLLVSIRLWRSTARVSEPGAIASTTQPRDGFRLRTAVRWLVIVVVVAHGLIHLLGAAKGLGWAEVGALSDPVSPAMGLVWLAAAELVVVAGGLLAVRTSWWWVVGAVSLVVSQVAIVTSWNDAKAGTVANVVLLVAVGYGFASQGPTSFRAEYRHATAAALSRPVPDVSTAVADSDLAHLPAPVAEYVRRSGAVGQPCVTSFCAVFHGRIRSDANGPWMSFRGEQVSTYGPELSRVFAMDAALYGLPVDVLHVFVGPAATMRVKLCSVVPIVDAAGPEMDRGETVTLFNDLCVLAPAALVDAPVVWQALDDTHARGTFTNGAHIVSANLTFDGAGDLVDFVSDDRLQASRDGSSFTARRWSTPVGDYRTVDARRVATRGECRWHPSEPASQYSYLEFNLDDITYNPVTPLNRDQRLTTDEVGSLATLG